MRTFTFTSEGNTYIYPVKHFTRMVISSAFNYVHIKDGKYYRVEESKEDIQNQLSGGK